jgi:hypothetical protein
MRAQITECMSNAERPENVHELLAAIDPHLAAGVFKEWLRVQRMFLLVASLTPALFTGLRWPGYSPVFAPPMRRCGRENGSGGYAKSAAPFCSLGGR